MALVLPDLCPFSGIGDEWPAYEDLIYGYFRADFVDPSPRIQFRGRPVNIRIDPADKGKANTFWHLMSEGDNEATRVPDFRRCERIRWPGALIRAAEVDRRVWAENNRGKFTHLGIALPDFSYVLFLREWPASYQLMTAYLVEPGYRRAKYEKEYQENKR
jgi:hypothetical protein